METFLEEAVWFYRLLLETFLRGMETRPKLRQPTMFPALKPSLEGWKPRPPSSTTPGSRALKPSLEGWKLAGPLATIGVAVP